MRTLVAPFALFFVAAGCQAPSSGRIVGGDLFIPAPSQIGARQEAVTEGDGPNGAHIIFLNFDGATINVGQNDDSATNTSWIPSMSGISGPIAYPAFDTSPYTGSMNADQVKQTIAQWMTMFFAPTNAQIVTTRPPSGTRYSMCMVGGTPQMVLGSQAGSAAGVAPLDCGNMVEENVVYAFAEVLTPNNTGSASESLKEIAVTCAQETAHGYGLGHTTNKMDIMYPQLSTQVTGFGGSSTLQSDGSGQCSNGATTQNSLQMLLDVIGPSTGMPMTGPQPVVSFVTPKDGSTVPLTFDIVVSASEAGGSISKVEVTSGGQTLFTATQPPYEITGIQAPQAGTYALKATATDSKGNFQSATVNVTASSSAPPQTQTCSTDGDCGQGRSCHNGMCMDGAPSGSCSQPCPSGQTCQNGACVPTGGNGGSGGSGGAGGMSNGQVGSSCTDGTQCTSGLCAASGDTHFCTQTCDPGVRASCPESTQCVATGMMNICEPNSVVGSNNAGCSFAAGRASDAAMLGVWMMLALLALPFARRRSRSRAR